MKKIIIPYLLLAAALTGCSQGNADWKPDQSTTVPKVYTNPVLGSDAPEPSVIRADNGSWYLFSDNTIHRSSDLVSWETVGNIFSTATWPQTERNGRLGDCRSTEIRYINGQYVVFYSLWFGDERFSVIGYASAEQPEGPFTDQGVLIDSEQIGVQQSIDPYYYEKDGARWLFWGSFHGIYAIALNISSEGVITTQGEKFQVAGTAFEGANVYERDGYYYLFASVGDSSGGAASTYQTVVGRSNDLMGPYVDKQGKEMLENNFEVVLQGNTHFSGPGHNAGLIEDGEGQTWIIYHAYQLNAADAGRMGMLDLVAWGSDGWPSVYDGTPSSVFAIPKFGSAE